MGRALEIASGTGEHVVRFAARTPGLTWHPTDPDPARRASIAAWSTEAGLPNIRAPEPLDAAAADWARDWRAAEGAADLVVLINLLHLISRPKAETVLRGIADVLAPGGVAILYGPFLRDGETTSEGDAAFDSALRSQDPEIGYKDVVDVVATLVKAGLTHAETQKMPANNLLLVLRKV